MPQRDPDALISDMVEASDRVAEVVRGKSLTDYSSDWQLRSIVERQFMVIGEALNQLLKLRPELENRVRGARPIVAFRNILVHGYHAIDDATVWGIVEEDLPRLQEDLASL